MLPVFFFFATMADAKRFTVEPSAAEHAWALAGTYRTSRRVKKRLPYSLPQVTK